MLLQINYIKKNILLFLFALVSCTNHIFVSTNHYVGGTLPQLPDTWVEILYNEEINSETNHVFLGGYKDALNFEIDTSLVKYKTKVSKKGTTIYFQITEKGNKYNLFKVIIKGKNFKLGCLFKKCVYIFSEPNDKIILYNKYFNREICINHNGIGYGQNCLRLYSQNQLGDWFLINAFDCPYYPEPFCFDTKDLNKGSYRLMLNNSIFYYFDIE